MSIRGPRVAPLLRSCLSCWAFSSFAPTSRTVVTPAARNNGKLSRSTNVAWTCVSISPGTTVFPLRSISCAPAGVGMGPLSIALMRSPFTTIDTFGRGWSAYSINESCILEDCCLRHIASFFSGLRVITHLLPQRVEEPPEPSSSTGSILRPARVTRLSVFSLCRRFSLTSHQLWNNSALADFTRDKRDVHPQDFDGEINVNMLKGIVHRVHMCVGAVGSFDSEHGRNICANKRNMVAIKGM